MYCSHWFSSHVRQPRSFPCQNHLLLQCLTLSAAIFIHVSKDCLTSAADIVPGLDTLDDCEPWTCFMGDPMISDILRLLSWADCFGWALDSASCLDLSLTMLIGWFYSLSEEPDIHLKSVSGAHLSNLFFIGPTSTMRWHPAAGTVQLTSLK